MSVIPVSFHTLLHDEPVEFHRYLHQSQPALSPAQLGASLYVPATRMDLAEIAGGCKFPQLRSVIFCTEDAVHEQDLTLGLANLAALLPKLESGSLLRFIRPRNPAVLQQLLQMDGIGQIDGFVLPKFDLHGFSDWLRVWDDRHHHWLMPILETAEAFDRRKMELLRDRLDENGWRNQVLCLRIGGNDLLNLLGIRRGRESTVYDTPLRNVIADLACIFLPFGYHLTAPVFEHLDTPETLALEVQCDLRHGLTGKTAIHPAQVAVIENGYRVCRSDYEMASAILAPEAAAVFQMSQAFCEPTTHRRWAMRVQERARLFGVV